MRQGVPEGRSSEEYASFKQVKRWPWHVEVIPGAGVVGLVTNKELCQVIWGVNLMNVMHKRSFIVSELLAGRFKVPLREYKYICLLTRGGRRGWGGVKLWPRQNRRCTRRSVFNEFAGF